MNFSPHPADIWTAEKRVQLHPSSAARQSSCKNALAFCYHIQTIWSRSHQPLNQKREGSASSFQRVRDAAKTSALKLKSWGLPGGHLRRRAQIARITLCHLQDFTGFDASPAKSQFKRWINGYYRRNTATARTCSHLRRKPTRLVSCLPPSSWDVTGRC